MIPGRSRVTTLEGWRSPGQGSSHPGLGIPIAVCLLAVGIALFGCQDSREVAQVRLPEQPIQRIELAGEVSEDWAEISGLAWCEDHLVLLPQFPGRFADHIFSVPRARILAYLAGEDTSSITPRMIPFIAAEVAESVPGFDGYEAIGFRGRQVFLTIETKGSEASQAYLVTGAMAPDFSRLTVNAATLATSPHQAGLHNVSDEALFIFADRIATIHEVNGANVNPNPVAHLFDPQLTPQGSIAFPVIEYRVTDATAADSAGYFWVMNYLYTRDLKVLKPGRDYWSDRFGTGETHAARPAVERLLELRYTSHSVERTSTPPILLRLAEDYTCRNWEGVVRLDQLGFLLVTDQYPETILAFVAHPACARVDSLPAGSAAAR